MFALLRSRVVLGCILLDHVVVVVLLLLDYGLFAVLGGGHWGDIAGKVKIQRESHERDIPYIYHW